MYMMRILPNSLLRRSFGRAAKSRNIPYISDKAFWYNFADERTADHTLLSRTASSNKHSEPNRISKD